MSEITDILEDFAENLAAAREVDNFAQLNAVVVEAVNEAETAIRQYYLSLLPEYWDDDHAAASGFNQAVNKMRRAIEND